MEAPMLLLTTLWLSSLFAHSIQECKEEYRKQRPTHTACLPPNRDCTIKKKGVSAAEREVILKTHNDYRSTLARGQLQGFAAATNMLQLLWDEELASVAQAKAEQCTDAHGSLNHDEYEDRFTSKFKDTGQNLAFRRSSAPFNSSDWHSNIKAWYVEYADYPPERVGAFRPPSGKPTGHFTQVVWATTRYVGCGYIDYTVAGATVMPYMQLYVCNYGGAGNTLTLPVYQAGDVCSSCPTGTVCVMDTGLCAPVKAEEEHNKESDNHEEGQDSPHKEPIKPGEVPNATHEEPDKPAPDALNKSPRQSDKDNEKTDKGTPTSARRSGGPNMVYLPCPLTWGAVFVAHWRI